ncbi:uncharacterized protein [Prorops nasuta]|uniref:uncharacterized protein isoform X2 n=1 Tax=Prorops nasuta TaxID=863751 RepID=UPI0034CEC862
MENFYNFVTNTGDTLTIEEVQRIYSVDGQSIQFVVEDNNVAIESQQLLHYTTEPQIHEQALITQQTINLGNQIATAQLEQGQNIYIIDTNDASSSLNITKATATRGVSGNILSITDNSNVKSLVQYNTDSQQIQWIKMQQNNINTGTVGKQNTGISEKSQTPTCSIFQHSKSEAVNVGSVERKTNRLIQNKNRHLSSSVQLGSGLSSDAAHIIESARDRMQNSNNKSLVVPLHNKVVKQIYGGQSQINTPQPRSPIRPRTSARPLGKEMEQLSERIKHEKLRQLQQSDGNQQNKLSTQSGLQQVTNSAVKRQNVQQQSTLATTPQKVLNQAVSPPHSPMDVENSPGYERNQLLQQSSPEFDNGSECESESLAYFRENIYNPSAAIVQHQIEDKEVKLLQLLPSGEQRLITFDIPNEECTVQDLLDQAKISFCRESALSLVTDPVLGINYILQSAPSALALQDGNDIGSDISQDTLSESYQNSLSDENSNSSTNQKPAFYKKNNERSLGTKIDKMEREMGMSKKIGKSKGRGGASRTRFIHKEPECLTISSDEEEDTNKSKKGDANCSGSQLNDDNSATNEQQQEMESLEKEPMITNNTSSLLNQSTISEKINKAGNADSENRQCTDSSIPPSCIALFCRTVRIGSYKFVPQGQVTISQNGLAFGVPLLEDANSYVKLNVKYSDIIKVLVHYGKSMPVLFFYTSTRAGATIREVLGMQDLKGAYYDPAGKDITHKRITLLPDDLPDDTKQKMQNLFSCPNTLEELNIKEANEILLRASPKDSLQVQSLTRRQSQTSTASNTNSNGGIQTITVYPPPPSKGGIAINTEDYLCLGEDQFLNDVIIDFYLKYLTLEVLSTNDQQRTHVFSSYFYKRLTSPHAQAAESNVPLSPPAKRHARVQKWTKNVNIFEKDFIIIPINEHAHWFLAIICFPGLVGKVPVSPVNEKTKDLQRTAHRIKKLKEHIITIGSTTITPVKTQTITIDQADDGSERDEAEGDDDEMEMDSDDDEEAENSEEVQNQRKQPDATPMEQKDIKVPCILIFDSLAGASRSRVVATLRDYLTCEHIAKVGEEKIFAKETIKGACPKVPQQSNFTDCGLYVLQYVESFFKNPIKDYTLPIKSLKNWFEEIVVTRKREELSQLLIKLMNATKGYKAFSLPTVNFPTQDGKLKVKPEAVEMKSTKTEIESKKKVNSESESRIINNSTSSVNSSDSTSELAIRTIPVSNSNALSNDSNSDSSNEPKVTPRTQTDTMNYLRAKRINRLPKTENQDESQTAKKHKGESFDSCK